GIRPGRCRWDGSSEESGHGWPGCCRGIGMTTNRRILFVDRDGCRSEEPADEQIDSYETLALLPGVSAALQRFVAAGYALVMVTNQDGLGTDSLPEPHFSGPHELLLRILASQGIRFREVLIDRSFPHE